MTTIVQLSAHVHNTRVQLNVRLTIKYVSNLPALANISSASVFKPQLAKLACRVSVMWRSIDRLHSPMRTYSALGYLVLEPHSPPTNARSTRTLYRRTFASRLVLAANDAYLFSALVYRMRPGYQD